MYTLLRIAFLFAAYSLVSFPSGQTQPVTFRRILDTNTAIPGESELVRSFTLADKTPILRNGKVLIPVSLTGSSGRRVLLYSDQGDLIETLPFRTSHLSFDGATVGGLLPGTTAVAKYREGSLVVVADSSTQIPGSAQTFGFFHRTAVSNGNMAFLASNSPSGSLSLYAEIDGTLSLVDSGTGQNFAMDDGIVYYTKSGAIYSYDGTAKTALITESTSLPDRPGTFASPSVGMSADRGGFAFMQGGSGGGCFNILAIKDADPDTSKGPPPGLPIYSFFEGTIRKVADVETPIPGGVGTFGGFCPNQYSFSNGYTTFLAVEGFDPVGIYTDFGGAIQPVFQLQHPVLDGKDVLVFNIMGKAMDANRVAIHFGFSDGSEGVYIATIQTPSLVDDWRRYR